MTFDPATLFSSGQAGAWYDPSNLATLFQDSAGTIPVVAAGDPVGLARDRSGNGHDWVQATAAKRPTYQVDGNGKAYLLFDGIDDYLQATFALALPFDRIAGIRQVSWGLNRYLFHSNGLAGLLFQNASSPQLRLSDGGGILQNNQLPVGETGVVTERHVAGASKLAVNSNAYVAADAGSGTPASYVSVGASSNGSAPSNIRLYGMLMRASLSDGEIAQLRSWMAGKCGLPPSRRLARHSWWI